MVQIDISGVPVGKRSDPRFTNLLAQMQAAVNDPAWQAAFGIHEIGHKIYLEKMGVTGFDFIGPRVEYDAAKDEFAGYTAAVKAQNIPLLVANGFDFNKWLNQLARSKAAGGVFSRRLTEAPDHGDAEDRSEFSRGCDMLREKMPGLQIDEDAIWKEAQEEILKDLRSPAYRRQCWDEANKIKAQLFGSE
jgi:hypothetical protein